MRPDDNATLASQSDYTRRAIINEPHYFYRHNSGNRCYLYAKVGVTILKDKVMLHHENHPKFTRSSFTL